MSTTIDTKITAAQACHIDGRAGYFRYRQAQLQALYNFVSTHRDAFVAAVRADTGKNEFEASLEVTLALKQLRTAFEATYFELLTARSEEQRANGHVETPQGIVLIVGHWTAPLDSILGPLTAAIAGGNVAVAILPASAMSTYELLASKINEAYPVLLGTEAVLTKALSFRFTSYYGTITNQNLRHQVLTAANRVSAPAHLVPAAADLQKHNVAIVSKTTAEAQLAHTAREIARGSFGCVGGQGLGGVSLVLVHTERHDALSRELVAATRELFPRVGRDTGSRDVTPLNKEDADIGKLCEVVKEGSMVCGGEWDAATGWFSPTVLENVAANSPVVFNPVPGPVLPMVPFTSTEDAIRIAQDITGHSLAVFGTQRERDYYAAALRPSQVTTGAPLTSLVGLTEGSAAQRYPLDLFVNTTNISTDAVGSDIFPPYSAWHVSALDKVLLPKYQKEVHAKRSMHQSSVGRNFFLQGAMLSLAVIFSSVGAAGVSAYLYFK